VSWSAAFWLLQSSPASLAGVLAGVLLLLAFRDTGTLPGVRAAIAVAMVLLAVLTIVELRRRGLEGSDPRDPRRIERAARDLRQELDRTALQLRAAAGAASEADISRSERSFDLLARIRYSAGPSAAVAILDRGGAPVAWSGKFLAAPSAAGSDSLAAHRTPFYVVLEARRQRADGGVAIAAATLWRDTAVAGNGESAPVALRYPSGVTVHFEPGAGTDSLRLSWPSESPVLAFELVPSSPQEAIGSLVGRARSLVAWLLFAFLLLAVVAGTTTALRFAPIVIGLPLALVYPFGESLGARSIFSPASFFSPLAGRLSGSAGALAVSAAVLLLGGVAAWGRIRLPRPSSNCQGFVVLPLRHKLCWR